MVNICKNKPAFLVSTKIVKKKKMKIQLNMQTLCCHWWKFPNFQSQ